MDGFDYVAGKEKPRAVIQPPAWFTRLAHKETIPGRPGIGAQFLSFDFPTKPRFVPSPEARGRDRLSRNEKSEGTRRCVAEYLRAAMGMV
jgi:hypothetical protein